MICLHYKEREYIRRKHFDNDKRDKHILDSCIALILSQSFGGINIFSSSVINLIVQQKKKGRLFLTNSQLFRELVQ